MSWRCGGWRRFRIVGPGACPALPAKRKTTVIPAKAGTQIAERGGRYPHYTHPPPPYRHPPLPSQTLFPGSAQRYPGSTIGDAERGFGNSRSRICSPLSRACVREKWKVGEEIEAARIPISPDLFRGLAKAALSSRFPLNQTPAQGRGKQARINPGKLEAVERERPAAYFGAEIWIGCPSAVSADSAKPSVSVGWTWIVPAMSSRRAPISTARANSPDSSETCVPTAWMPRMT